MPQQQGPERFELTNPLTGESIVVMGTRPPTQDEARQIMAGRQVPGFSGEAQQPEGPPGFLARGTESFLETQPVQDPRRIVSELAEAGPSGIARGLASGAAETFRRGMTDPSTPFDPLSAVVRSANAPLALLPGIGPSISERVVEPLAQAVSLQPSDDRLGDVGEALGGTLGTGISLATDKGLGTLVGRATKRGREAISARESGVPLSAGQREGASSITRMGESLVSRLPGGRNVIENFRVFQQRALVNNGVNRLLEDAATFEGPKLLMTKKVQQGVDNIVEQLRVQNRANYQAFEAALPPRTMVDATPVADIATKILGRLEAEAVLVNAPELQGLIGDVRRLSDLSGVGVPVTAATDARSTLLRLARRLDNPLGSKQEAIVNQIFSPIDEGIEASLRRVGGDDLVTQWRQANKGVRDMHKLVDDTLFEEVIKTRRPESIASIFESAPAEDLARMKGRLDPQLWDQTRTLILRDKFAKAVRGESPRVARGGAAGGGSPLRVELDPGSSPRVSADSALEGLNSIDEAVRAVLFSDEELRAIERLAEVARRAGPQTEQIATLVGSGIAATLVVGAGGASLGALVGTGTAMAAGAGLANLGAATAGARVLAEIFTKPEILDFITASLEGAAFSAVTTTFMGQQILNTLSDDALREFVAENNIAPNQITPEVRQRLFTPQAQQQNTLQNLFGLNR